MNTSDQNGPRIAKNVSVSHTHIVGLGMNGIREQWFQRIIQSTIDILF